MKLPDGRHVFIDIRKLAEYVLNLDHPLGRNKARVFKAVLGITAEQAGALRETIIVGVRDGQWIWTRSDEFGDRFYIDCPVSTVRGSAIVRTAWIVRTGEDFPRLTTCYVLSGKRENS